MADGDSTRQLSGGRPPRPPAISRTIRRLTANRVQLFAAVVKRAPARPRKSRSSADGSFCCPELIQTLARGPVGPRLALHRPPWVLLATEAPGHARQRVRLWLRPSQLPPVDRRGHRRTALGPHRVRRHRRLPPAVATGVDEQPSRPLGLVALDRQPLGVAAGQQRSGVTTWNPLDPEVCTNGTRPSSWSRSRTRRAASRTRCTALSSGGSRSNTTRSGCSRWATREVQVCSVTTPRLAR